MFRLWSLFACRDWCFGIDFTWRKARFRAVWLLRIAHTNNCFKGIEKIIELSPRYFLIGLYHKYGRKPFLEHFDNLKLKFKDLKKTDLENALFE